MKSAKRSRGKDHGGAKVKDRPLIAFQKKDQKPVPLIDLRWKCLSLQPLTIFIHLNLNGMKKKLSMKSVKMARMFGSVESFIYLCR